MKDNSLNGLKKTKPRMAIFEIFQNQDRPISAQEIYSLLEQEKSPLWYSTIYRVLEDFSSKNVIRRIDFNYINTSLYVASSFPHYHYAMCEKCLQPIIMRQCPINQDEIKLDDENFKVTSHEIQLYGICSKCLANA